MSAGPFDAIQDNPEVVFQEEDGAPVNASAWMPLVAVVLALTQSPVSIVFETQQLGPGPIKALELPVMKHLVAAVHLSCVVTFGAKKVVVPLLRSVV